MGLEAASETLGSSIAKSPMACSASKRERIRSSVLEFGRPSPGLLVEKHMYSDGRKATRHKVAMGPRDLTINLIRLPCHLRASSVAFQKPYLGSHGFALGFQRQKPFKSSEVSRQRASHLPFFVELNS